MLCLSGCANINYTRIVYDTGAIKDVYSVQFEINTIETTLKAHEFSQAQCDHFIARFFSRTEQLMKDYADRQTEGFIALSSKAVVDGHVSEEDNFYFQTKIHFNAYIDPEYNEVKYTRTFDTNEAFDYYYDLLNNFEEEEEESGYVLEEGFFFHRYAIEVESFYLNVVDVLKTQGAEVFGVTYEELLTEFGLGIFDETKDIDVTQSYISTESKLHSDADYETFEGGYYLKEWNLSTTDTTMLKYYYYVANAPTWYIGAIAIALLVVVGLVVVVLLKRIKKSKI